MARLLLTRLLVFAAPFVVYFIWREVARRSGREMGSTPWPWLVASGLIFVALSLMSGAFWYRDSNLGRVYVPGQADNSGRVSPGHFEKARP